MIWFNKWILPVLAGMAIFGLTMLVDNRDYIFNILFGVTVMLACYVITAVIK